MQLEDYFNFRNRHSARWLASGLKPFCTSTSIAPDPEEIAQLTLPLHLEQVHATILYYLHNKETARNTLLIGLEYCLKSESESRMKIRSLYSQTSQVESRARSSHTGFK